MLSFVALHDEIKLRRYVLRFDHRQRHRLAETVLSQQARLHLVDEMVLAAHFTLRLHELAPRAFLQRDFVLKFGFGGERLSALTAAAGATGRAANIRAFQKNDLGSRSGKCVGDFVLEINALVVERAAALPAHVCRPLRQRRRR